MANRNFSPRQALEKGMIDLYAKAVVSSDVAAQAILATTAPITLTSVVKGPARNTSTFSVVVDAAAANPTDTILVDITGSAAAIICTVTPNDGTNNAAVAVDLTTAELVELINTGVVAGKTVTVTDAGTLIDDQTAVGGGTEVLVQAGEGDGVIGTFAGGLEAPLVLSGQGVKSIVQTATGEYTLTLEDKYFQLKDFKVMVLNPTALGLSFQLVSEDVGGTKEIKFLSLVGTTATDVPDAATLIVKIDLKNSHAI